MKEIKENQALVRGLDIPTSWKDSVEVCRFLRRKKLQMAKKMLQQVLDKKLSVPIRRHGFGDRGHRPGKIGPGFYPQKATKYILNLLNTLEANAQDKGLNVQNLVLKELIPNKASTPWHPGRHRRRKMKRAHIYIIAEEVKSTKEVKGVKAKK